MEEQVPVSEKLKTITIIAKDTGEKTFYGVLKRYLKIEPTDEQYAAIKRNGEKIGDKNVLNPNDVLEITILDPKFDASRIGSGPLETLGLTVLSDEITSTKLGVLLEKASLAIQEQQKNGKENKEQIEKFLRMALNEMLYNQTLSAQKRGVKYGLGNQNSQKQEKRDAWKIFKGQVDPQKSPTGFYIDCSGWVAEITREYFNTIRSQVTAKELVKPEAFEIMKAHLVDLSSESVINGIEDHGGTTNVTKILQQKGINEVIKLLKPGMVIGFDTGNAGYDAGRKKGIDHIAQVIKDPKTGKLMTTESTPIKGSTSIRYMPAEDWLKHFQSKITGIWIGDPLVLLNL